MRARRGPVVSLVAALAAAGCVGLWGETIWEAPRLNAVTPLEFSAFAAAGPAVEIRGAAPGGATPAEVAAALRMPARYPAAPFRLVGPADGTPPMQGALRLVFAFGATGPADGRALCAGGGTVPTAQTGRFEVLGALCIGPNADSAARLSHETPLSPADPAFTGVMTRLIGVLSPREGEFRRRGCPIPPC